MASAAATGFLVAVATAPSIFASLASVAPTAPPPARPKDFVATAEAEVVGPDGLPAPGTPPYKARNALLRRVAALERGALATPLDDKKVRSLGEKLRLAASEPGRECWRASFADAAGLDRLEGRWRLIYTSGFVREGGRASLGGLRAGPRLDSPLLEVGDIYQVYRTNASSADTEVTLRPPKWLRNTGILEGLPFSSGDPNTVLTPSQQFGVAAHDTLRFAFSDGQVANRFFEQLKPLRFPMTPYGFSSDTSSDTPFTDTLTTTYCDGDLRLGVGGRFGEFRVFRRA